MTVEKQSLAHNTSNGMNGHHTHYAHPQAGDVKSHVQVNGHANGHTNVLANGYTDGHVNGHANGLADGFTNGYHTEAMGSAEPIAICGMAMRLPGGINDAETFSDALCQGKDMRREIPAERYQQRPGEERCHQNPTWVFLRR